MGNKTRARGADGRFHGGRRVDVESVLRLPTFPVAWALADPRRRPDFVFWTGLDDTLAYVIRLERTEERGTVQLRTPEGESFPVGLLRRPMPRRGGKAIFFLCPWCGHPRRFLYLRSLVLNRLVSYQGPRCPACAGLRWSSQGRYIGAFARTFIWGIADGRPVRRLPYARHPRDPGAVSDPQLVMAEFPDHFRQVQPVQTVPAPTRASHGVRAGAPGTSSS